MDTKVKKNMGRPLCHWIGLDSTCQKITVSTPSVSRANPGDQFELSVRVPLTFLKPNF